MNSFFCLFFAEIKMAVKFRINQKWKSWDKKAIKWDQFSSNGIRRDLTHIIWVLKVQVWILAVFISHVHSMQYMRNNLLI